jgi:hypothetical protein
MRTILKPAGTTWRGVVTGARSPNSATKASPSKPKSGRRQKSTSLEPAGQRDVLSGHVAEVRELREPFVGEVVGADDARVGGRALTPVELAVRSYHRIVGLVVAPARQVGDDVLETAVGPRCARGCRCWRRRGTRCATRRR